MSVKARVHRGNGGEGGTTGPLPRCDDGRSDTERASCTARPCVPECAALKWNKPGRVSGIPGEDAARSSAGLVKKDTGATSSEVAPVGGGRT